MVEQNFVFTLFALSQSVTPQRCFKQVMRRTLRTANAAQTGIQSDDCRHSLCLTHHRVSVRRTASFWIKIWLGNNEFCTSWDTVCTIIALFQQEVATRRQHCTFFSTHTRDFPSTFFLVVTVNTWLLILSFHLQRQRWFVLVLAPLTLVQLWLWSFGLFACANAACWILSQMWLMCECVQNLCHIIPWIASIGSMPNAHRNKKQTKKTDQIADIPKIKGQYPQKESPRGVSSEQNGDVYHRDVC